MDKKTVNPGLVFLLVLLVVAGMFLLYSKMSLTGNVTNIGNATDGVLISSRVFDEGDFSNTAVTSGVVALMPTKITGTYMSPIFDAGQNVFWKDFLTATVSHSSSNYTEDPLNNSVLFYVRACNTSSCSERNFDLFTGNLHALGQYFQYRVVMEVLSGNVSPSFSEVNVSYYPPLTPSIVITSPQNITYNNETVAIALSSSQNGTIWFYNGTDNEVYAAGINKTFAEGAHVLHVYTSYIDGRINYSNEASVNFVVGFPKVFYRFSDNACSAVTITTAQKTANDYTTITDCQSHITTTTTTTTTDSDTTPTACSPSWECSWGECVDGMQTELCVDVSTCTTVATPPAARTQPCTGGTTTTPVTTTAETTPIETTTTETATPEKKGFFSFVGSAIVGPIFKSKITVVFLIVLVLGAGGFFAYKFFLKDKLKLNFNFFKKKKKFFFFN